MSNPVTIGAFEAKTKFSELLERVSRGEEITITKHEKPV
jgi:prevent-host-death family protein